MRGHHQAASPGCPMRREDLIEAEVDGDLLLYDRSNHHAFSLNGSAAALWRRCDGETSVPDILQGDKAAWDALCRLAADGLVDGVPNEMPQPEVSRRSFVRKGAVAVAGAAALPVIEMVVVPPAAAHASGLPNSWGGGGGSGGGGGGTTVYTVNVTKNGYTLNGTITGSSFTGTLQYLRFPAVKVTGTYNGTTITVHAWGQAFTFKYP